MIERTLPWWLRVILLVTAASQTFFGLTLLVNPGAIGSLWPWPMTAITARLLAASTLVSVPLEVLAVMANRWTVARIPIVMLLTYRVLQIAAGLIHVDRFDFTSPTTLNYFGGGGFMMVVLAFSLVRGPLLGQPASGYQPWLRGDTPLVIPEAGKNLLRAIAVVYFLLGVAFLVLGRGAGPLWFEAEGQLTPLTARLFASPMVGLALGLWLITLATRWREVVVPAIGMATFGVAGLFTLIIERAAVAPPSPLGYVTASTPLLLLLIGLLLAVARPGALPVQPVITR